MPGKLSEIAWEECTGSFFSGNKSLNHMEIPVCPWARHFNPGRPAEPQWSLLNAWQLTATTWGMCTTVLPMYKLHWRTIQFKSMTLYSWSHPLLESECGVLFTKVLWIKDTFFHGNKNTYLWDFNSMCRLTVTPFILINTWFRNLNCWSWIPNHS